MKQLILILALTLVSCGQVTGKDGTGDPNNGSNNAGSNNAGSNNTTSANNPVVNPPVPANNTSTNNEPSVACSSRVDCRVDQECVAGACTDHQECFSSGGGTGAGCEFEWSECADGKAYALFCNLLDDGVTVACDCTVNDTVVDSFSGDVNEICEAGHRAANDNCGWLLPEAF